MSGDDLASFPGDNWVVTQHISHENRDEYSCVTTNIKSAKQHGKKITTTTTNKREKKLESRLDPQVFEKNSTCFL